jgi:hypothetical protein
MIECKPTPYLIL